MRVVATKCRHDPTEWERDGEETEPDWYRGQAVPNLAFGAPDGTSAPRYYLRLTLLLQRLTNGRDNRRFDPSGN